MERIIKNREFKIASREKLVEVYRTLLPTNVVGVICDFAFISIKKYQDDFRKKNDRVVYDLMRTFDLSSVTKWTIPFNTVVYSLDWELKQGKYYWLGKYNSTMLDLKRSKERYQEEYF